MRIAKLAGYDGLDGVDKGQLSGKYFDGMMDKCMVTWPSWLNSLGYLTWLRNGPEMIPFSQVVRLSM